MTDEQIKKLLDNEYLRDLEKELMKIYPNGFDINKIDRRIKNKIEELAKRYDNIQKPIQKRNKVKK